VVQEKVLWLDVSMSDPSRMKILKALTTSENNGVRGESRTLSKSEKREIASA
jgi:hypothetical protein